jgi:RpiR family glv operon transcriptional regulator
VDFYEYTLPVLGTFSETEQALYDYIVKNMQTVQVMSIRTLARVNFVSTTTMFRFVRKLGFKGYVDFINTIRLTVITNNNSDTTSSTILKNNYLDIYLDNIQETIRVLDMENIDRLYELLDNKPTIYLLSEGPSSEVAESAKYYFSVLGFNVVFPKKRYEFNVTIDQIHDSDLIFSISFLGTNSMVIDTIEHMFFEKRPKLVSITCSQNNQLKHLSDINFYIFSDSVTHSGFDITSRVSVLILIDIITYGWIARSKKQ